MVLFGKKREAQTEPSPYPSWITERLSDETIGVLLAPAVPRALVVEVLRKALRHSYHAVEAAKAFVERLYDGDGKDSGAIAMFVQSLNKIHPISQRVSTPSDEELLGIAAITVEAGIIVGAGGDRPEAISSLMRSLQDESHRQIQMKPTDAFQAGGNAINGIVSELKRNLPTD